MKVKFLFFLVLVFSVPLTLAQDKRLDDIFNEVNQMKPAPRAESETQHRYKVSVSVLGDDETITNLPTSHLKKELRALGDVDVVGYGDDWEYFINVFYVETKTADGAKTGSLAIARSFAKRVPKFYFKEIASLTIATFRETLGVAY